MKRVIVDVSSLMWSALLGGKDVENGRTVEVDGKAVQVNSRYHAYDNAINTLVGALRRFDATPSDTLLVVEGSMSTAQRKAIYKDYKGTRKPRAEELQIEFNAARDLVCSTMAAWGAVCISQEGVEADDVIGWLAEKLDGDKLIVSQDGDLCVLLGPKVSQYRNGGITNENPLGPFPSRFITLYKALVGDTSDNLKGAHGFGDTAFLKMFAQYGLPGLAGIEGMIKRDCLNELIDDVKDFAPFRKVVDARETVRACWQAAKLYPEWVNTPRQPLRLWKTDVAPENEGRLRAFKPDGSLLQAMQNLLNPPKPAPIPRKQKRYAVFDTEIIGKHQPVFLFCAKWLDTGETVSLWKHKDGDMDKLKAVLAREDTTFVSFNGINFDAPVIWAAVDPKNDVALVKEIAQVIIERDERSWTVRDMYGLDAIEFDHIDLMEVSPGVRISLKAFAGRMHYPTMVDLPFEHDQDLREDECATLESYCLNDLGVTEALFNALRVEIELREDMSDEHGIDLRSKSDAQLAEALLKKAAGIGRSTGNVPAFVHYKAPSFIQTDDKEIIKLIEKIENHAFKINPANGQPVAPDFLSEPLRFGFGTYQLGVGGIHSTHDSKVLHESRDGFCLSDWDVASYYPNIMLACDLIPSINSDLAAGQRFINAYRSMYEKRMVAKREGNKKVANSLKIACNGTFGKLGSVYCGFYSPDLMLAVTLTGQLNLLCLIVEIEKTGAIVLSANTDGILVSYKEDRRDDVVQTIAGNAKRTGFTYEETPYKRAAFKDVNNYIAITAESEALIVEPENVIRSKAAGGDAKRKGLYAKTSLMKNPTAEVCSTMAADYLRDGIHPRESVARYTNVRDFVAVRAVKGGGVQPTHWVEIDDWILVNDLGTKDNEWRRPCWPEGKVLKRKSRPAPVTEGVGGEPFGRMARWYMSAQSPGPLVYVGSGNKVPKTEGAMLCLTLPETLPADLDRQWYVNEAISMLSDMGVEIS